MTSAAEGGRKILAFFFVEKSGFQWENYEFWGISESNESKILEISNFDERKFWRK